VADVLALALRPVEERPVESRDQLARAA